MLITQEIEVPITQRNIARYRTKGYAIDLAIGKSIIAKVEDLPSSSHLRIKYKCDNCGEECETSWCSWNKRTHKELGDMCKSCARQIKQPQSMIDKYGYSNSANVPILIEKKKQTNIEKYGVEWAVGAESTREAIKKTIFDKYGVQNPMQNQEIKNRAIKAMAEVYAESKDVIQAKRKETCLKKYGCVNPYQNKDIQAKARQTLYQNGTVPSSKAEHEFCSILQDVFGGDNCFPSYPVGNLSLDCLVVFDGYKIDFEYDGFYWHKDKAQTDGARNAVLMNEGYRIIRVKADNKDTMPTIQQIQEAVDYLVKDNHHITFINMNN